MNKDLLSRITGKELKVVALSSLFALAAAGTPALAMQQDQGQQQDQATQQQGPAAQQQQQQDQAAMDRDDNDTGWLGDDELQPGADLSEMPAGALDGAEVTNARGEVIGNVSDLVVDTQDQTLHAVIDVGGWLGIGGTQVAVAVEELEIQSEDQVMYPTDATEEQIEEQAQDFRDTEAEDRYVSLDDWQDLQLGFFMEEGERDLQRAELEDDQAMQEDDQATLQEDDQAMQEDDQAALQDDDQAMQQDDQATFDDDDTAQQNGLQ